MNVMAITRFARLSPSKIRDLAKRVQGMSVADALKVTDFSERKGARLLSKTLKSAVANAEHNAKLAVDELTVAKAVVEDGPRMRRAWARARGSVSPILKRTCHVRVVLTDGRKTEEPGA
jgi:large subunit ribosomal protein L22